MPDFKFHTVGLGRIISICLAVSILLLTVAYSIAVVTRGIPNDQRIDSVQFGMLIFMTVIVILLLKPNVLDRLGRLEVSGFKLEMLERVKEKQVEQQEVLESINLMLPLLLPETERKHLFNLSRGKTKGYDGRSSMRAELRRLRSIGLVRCREGKHIGDMKSGNRWDLADFVELTPQGEKWLHLIERIEKSDSEADEGNKS